MPLTSLIKASKCFGLIHRQFVSVAASFDSFLSAQSLLPKKIGIACSMSVIALGLAWNASAATPLVTLEKIGGEFELRVDGEPYRIHGAGGSSQLAELAAAGGNTIRTWGVGAETRDLLDEAHSHGLKVVVGIWLGHERHGFNYSDEASLAQQKQMVRDAVLEYKDHPAVLIWALGNEMEGFGELNPKVWHHLEECAAMVQKLDETRPVMTVVAEIGGNGEKVTQIAEYCPSIDIIGVNSYGGAVSLPDRYAATGVDIPYIVTEYGPNGPWEVTANSWGAALELPSTQKGEYYRNSFESIEADAGNSLGSFAFLWGYKEEATSTWFGMYLPTGDKTEAVDTMTYLWSGKWPENRVPQIKRFEALGNLEIKSGETLKVELDVEDPEGKPIQTKWEFRIDPMDTMTGGDERVTPPNYDDAIIESSASGATFRMPEEAGFYRLFVYISDGEGGGASANLPVRVIGETTEFDSPRLGMPLDLLSEQASPYAISGYMGNAGAVKMDSNWTKQAKVGPTATRVHYSAPSSWVGVVWQHPANDWGDLDGGFDLNRAEKLSFWVKGEKGGEVVTFGYGLFAADKAFYDTDREERKITLTKNWQKVEFDVAEKNLSRIKTPFYWVIAGNGSPTTFYLDDVKYE